MKWYKVVLSSILTMLGAGTAYLAWFKMLPYMQAMFTSELARFGCIIAVGWFGGISIPLCLLFLALAALVADC